MMTSRDAEPGFAALTPAQTGWVNQVGARVALRVGLYRPGRLVARLDCYVGEPFEHAVADQVEFLRRTLNVSAPAANA
jgi:hypothetical protein